LAPHAQARSAPQSSTLRGWPLLHRPMIPFVNPAPLSAWTLLGTRIAKPHPFARTCSCQFGPRALPFPPKPPPNPPPTPNSITTGTGPFALSGAVSDSWTSTVTCGYDELSTRPTSCLVTTGTSPIVRLLVPVTSHFTFGTSLGTRP